MDGLETLRQLKKRLPDVPVVMLSGHGQARTIVEAMRLGASDFLRKPFEVEELELAFQKALEKRALKQEVEQLRGRARTETELLMLGGDNAEDARDPRDHRAGRRHRHHRADPRRERHRQGAGRARALPALRTAATSPSSRSTARRCPRSCSRASSSASRRAPSPAPRSASSASSSTRTAARSSSTRSARCIPGLQAKLLQVLQDGEFARLGGEADVQGRRAHHRRDQPRPRGGGRRRRASARTSTTASTWSRSSIPPLRERIDAVPLLVDHFLQQVQRAVQQGRASSSRPRP